MATGATEFQDAQNKKNGYLMKKSTAGDWQKRYFETNGTFLTYYKSQKMSKLLAALSLPQVGEISTCANGEASTFQLDLKDRQYILKANSPEEAQSWVETLTYLRDGGGVAQKTKSAASSPIKSIDAEDQNQGVASLPSPKTMAQEPANAGVFVKQDRSLSTDNCTAGCRIS